MTAAKALKQAKKWYDEQLAIIEKKYK